MSGEQPPSEIFLVLQEVHSSINFLKSKLSATDQKLRAASEEGPIRVDGRGIPWTGGGNAAATFTSRGTPAGGELSDPDTRTKVSTRERDVARVLKGVPRRRKQSVLVEPVCINARQTAQPGWSLLGGAFSAGATLLGHAGSIRKQTTQSAGHASDHAAGTTRKSESKDWRRQTTAAIDDCIPPRETRAANASALSRRRDSERGRTLPDPTRNGQQKVDVFPEKNWNPGPERGSDTQAREMDFENAGLDVCKEALLRHQALSLLLTRSVISRREEFPGEKRPAGTVSGFGTGCYVADDMQPCMKRKVTTVRKVHGYIGSTVHPGNKVSRKVCRIGKKAKVVNNENATLAGRGREPNAAKAGGGPATSARGEAFEKRRLSQSGSVKRKSLAEVAGLSCEQKLSRYDTSARTGSVVRHRRHERKQTSSAAARAKAGRTSSTQEETSERMESKGVQVEHAVPEASPDDEYRNGEREQVVARVPVVSDSSESSRVSSSSAGRSLAHETTTGYTYCRTEQVEHLKEMMAYIDERINKELARGNHPPIPSGTAGDRHGSVASRICRALSLFDVTELEDVGKPRPDSMPRHPSAPEENDARLRMLGEEKDRAARKIQRWFRKKKLLGQTNPVNSHEERDGHTSPVADDDKSDDDVSFYNLAPEPFTFARAMKLKDRNGRSGSLVRGSIEMGRFMTSTQSEGNLSPDFSVSTLDTAPKENLHRASSERYLGGDDTVVSVTLSGDESAAPRGSAPGRSTERRTSAEACGGIEIPQGEEKEDAAEAAGGPEERVWQVLQKQIEAAKAARPAGKVNGASLLPERSQEVITLLTDSTVAAASALTSSLVMQEPQRVLTPSREPRSVPGETVSHSRTKSGRDASETDGSECCEQCRVDGTSSSEASERSSADVMSADKQEAREGCGKRPSLGTSSSPTSDQERSHGQELSQSSSRDPVLLDKQLLSFSSSVSSSYLLVPEVEGKPRLALLRLHEKSLIQKTRAELAWLEVLKRKCKECGAENKVPALRKKQRGLILKLHDRCAQLKQMQESRGEADVEPTPQADTSSAASDASSLGGESTHSPSNHLPSLSSSQSVEITASLVSTLIEETPVEKADGESAEEAKTLTGSDSGPHESPRSAAVNLDSSKMVLEEWQQHLKERRRNVQELLEWRQRLNAEEEAVRAMEREAFLNVVPLKRKTPRASSAMGEADPSHQEPSTASEKDVESETPQSVTEAVSSSLVQSCREDLTSQVDQKPCRLPSSRAPLIKNPLLSRLKGRRDSSGSEDSFNVSCSETASEQSDLEGQTLALKEELKKRQLEAARLRKEQRRCHREFLRQKERVLRKHIEMYDKLIEQATADLEKEKSRSASVRPQIKRPVVMEQHRRVSLDVAASPSRTSPSSRTEVPEEEQPTESCNTHLTGSPEQKEDNTDVCGAATLSDRHTESDTRRDSSAKEISSDAGVISSADDSSQEATAEVQTESQPPSSEKEIAQKSVQIILERSCSISEDFNSSVASPDSSKAAVEDLLQFAKSEASSDGHNVVDGGGTVEGSRCTTDAEVDGSDAQSAKSCGSRRPSLSASRSAEDCVRSEPDVEVQRKESSAEMASLNCSDLAEEASSEVVSLQPETKESGDDKGTETSGGGSLPAESVRDDERKSAKVEALVDGILMDLFRDAVAAAKNVALAKTSVSACEEESCVDEDCLETGEITRLQASTGSTAESCSREIAPVEVEAVNSDNEVGITDLTVARPESEARRDSGEDELREKSVGLCKTHCDDKTVKRTLNENNVDRLLKDLLACAINTTLKTAREKRECIRSGVQHGLRENDSQSAVSAAADSEVSNVSKKLSLILGSLEQKRSHRELLRPQDMMILSTDLDEDMTSLDPGVSPSPEGSEEGDPPGSDRGQSGAGAISPIPTESDWFEDDLGFGAPLQAAYPRQIPNKPPPPYSPPKGGSLSNVAKRTSPEATFVIPHKAEEVEGICRSSAAVVYEALRKGESLRSVDWQLPGNSPGKEADQRSWAAFCQFLFSLTKEVAQDVFCIEEATPPAWQRSLAIRRKVPLPSSRGQFVDEVSEKVLTLRGVGPRKAPSAPLPPAARIQRCKRTDNPLEDEVDDAASLVLQREICQEDLQWLDCSSEEVAVKEFVADAIFLYVLDDTVVALKRAWES